MAAVSFARPGPAGLSRTHRSRCPQSPPNGPGPAPIASRPARCAAGSAATARASWRSATGAKKLRQPDDPALDCYPKEILRREQPLGTVPADGDDARALPVRAVLRIPATGELLAPQVDDDLLARRREQPLERATRNPDPTAPDVRVGDTLRAVNRSDPAGQDPLAASPHAIGGGRRPCRGSRVPPGLTRRWSDVSVRPMDRTTSSGSQKRRSRSVRSADVGRDPSSRSSGRRSSSSNTAASDTGGLSQADARD